MKNPTLEWARRYVAAGYEVLPLHSILEPAPENIVAAFERGKLPKKEAVTHARCSCGHADCRSPGKHPHNKNGATMATTDLEQIEAWWRRWPDANIGLRMPPGRFAVDFDLYEPGVKERLADFVKDFTEETAIQTSGGGEHWIFDGVDPAFAFATTLDATSGVDLIHNGHRYLVAAPSVHWTGRVYEWQTKTIKPSAAPEALLARCGRAAKGTKTPKKRAKTEGARSSTKRSKWANVRIDDVPPAPCPPHVTPEQWGKTLALTLPPAVSDDEDGSREHGHASLMRAAGYLVSGLALDPGVACALLWEHYNPRCVPPWTKKDRRDFERVVAKAAEQEPDGRLLPADLQPEKEREPLENPFEAIGELVDLSKPIPPLKYRVDNVFAPGKVSIIFARPEGGKSPLAQWIAVCCALGRQVFPDAPKRQWQTEQCPVIYCDYETGDLALERLQRMCNALETSVEALRGVYHHVKAEHSFSVEMLDGLEQAVEQTGAGLIVVDTYAAGLPGDVDYSSGQFAHWLRQLGRLSTIWDVTVIVNMHSRKGDGDGEDLEAISGNFGAAGAAQTAIRLVPRKDTNVIEVRCARHPRVKWPPFRIEWIDLDGGDTKYSGVTVEGVAWGLAPIYLEGDAPRTEHNEREAERAKERREEAESRVLECLRKHGPQREGQVLSGALVPRRAGADALSALVRRGEVTQERLGKAYVYTARTGKHSVRQRGLDERRKRD